MLVKQLKDILDKFDDDRPVILEFPSVDSTSLVSNGDKDATPDNAVYIGVDNDENTDVIVTKSIALWESGEYKEWLPLAGHSLSETCEDCP